MRKGFVTAAVLGIIALSGAPALAASPEVSQRSCEAGGGSFERNQGVKTCTTTTTDTVTSQPVTLISEVTTAGVTDRYTGVSTRTDVVETTTVQSQKGNGEVASTQSSSVLSSTVTPVSCHLRQTIFSTVIFSGQAPFADCAAHGVFLQPAPLGPVA